MGLSRLTVPALFPRGEEAVVVASGSTVTSSKGSERSLLMAAHLHGILRVMIITGVVEQGGELLSTSQRTTPSLTSGEYSQIQTRVRLNV